MPDLPNPWTNCRFEREANEAPACPYCGEAVEDEDQTCEDCHAIAVEDAMADERRDHMENR